MKRSHAHRTVPTLGRPRVDQELVERVRAARTSGILDEVRTLPSGARVGWRVGGPSLYERMLAARPRSPSCAG